MALKAVTKSVLLLGECVPCVKSQASKFKVKRLELDEYILKYYPKVEYVYAYDPDKKCKSGDIALIEQLPKKKTRLITHSVKEIVFPMGDVTDPLTNKKVVAGKFREHIDAVNKVYGKSRAAFDYQSAPDRGWQEDKKDFSHKETYVKYHEYENKDQPYAV